MRVYKQGKSPFWTADYTTPGGDRVQKSTRCKDRGAALRIAREWERAAEHEAADAAAGIVRPSRLTMADLIADYDEAISNDDHSPETVRSYSGHFRAYIVPFFGRDTEAASITRAAVEGFRRAILTGDIQSKRVASRRSAVPRPATANRIMVTLRRLFDFGVRRGDLRDNPAKNLPVLKERPDDRHRALSDREIAALAFHLERKTTKRKDNAPWMRFAIQTGLRDSELETLMWGDVDLQLRRLRIRADESKGAESRMVPLTTDAACIIEAMPHRVGLVWGEHDRRKALVTAWARTRLPGRAPTAHDFRHTFASRAIAAGLDLEELRQVMGHDSVVTTQRYLHDYGDRWAGMAAKLQGPA